MQDSTGDNQNYLMGVAGVGFEVDWSSGARSWAGGLGTYLQVIFFFFCIHRLVRPGQP